MKKLFLLCLGGLLFTQANGQIKIGSDSDVLASAKIEPYDSLSNWYFEKEVRKILVSENEGARQRAQKALFNKYLGQKLYVLPLSSFDKKSVEYDLLIRKIDSLSNKYYTIKRIESIIDPVFNTSYSSVKYKLTLVGTRGTVYTFTTTYDNLKTYTLLNGYYEKLKKLYINKSFIYTGIASGMNADEINEKLTHTAIDRKTGNQIELRIGEKWTCKDLMIFEDKYYQHLYFIYEDAKGRSIKVRVENEWDSFNDRNIIFNSCFKSEVDYLKMKLRIGNPSVKSL